MTSFATTILQSSSRPLADFSHHYKHSSDRLIYAGWIGFYGFILFYFIYTLEDWFFFQSGSSITPQSASFRPSEFENLWIRFIASISCLILALKTIWPKALVRFYLTYAYFVIIYCLPFFHTYMILISNGHTSYLIDAMVALFLMILLVDWLNVLVMYLLGTLAACCIFIVSSDPSFQFSWPDSYLACLPNMVLAILGGALFHFSNYQIEKEKIKAIASVSGNMAHELINPLFAIRCLTQAIRQDLSTLNTKDQCSCDETVSSKISNELTRIDSIIKRSNKTITMILSTANRGPIKTSQFEYCHVSQCIAEALLDCNQTSKNRKSFTESVIEADTSHDFLFYGSKDLLVNVIINLINNSIYFIKKHNRGKIRINIGSKTFYKEKEPNTKYNCLTVLDTAIGIPKDVMPFIFDDFFTTRSDQGGSGLGLGFCRRVLKSFGGDILCNSKYGEYCHFILLFPVINKKMAQEESQ